MVLVGAMEKKNSVPGVLEKYKKYNGQLQRDKALMANYNDENAVGLRLGVE